MFDRQLVCRYCNANNKQNDVSASDTRISKFVVELSPNNPNPKV